ncbi:MAG: 4-hydroxy-tetrahydrodipicolinate synthase [Victivallales bacterium]
MELKGVYTAIVTPFSGGKVDFKKLAQLVDIQIKAGVDGIVPVGTTGESPTLSYEEHIMVIEKVIEASKGRCKIVAGTGANSTDEAVFLTKEARKAGADATLQVTPYYNKPTPEGLYRHFSEIADRCGLPVVLYNVPGRCGIAIPVEVISRLSKNKNIIAVKEAGGSVDRVSSILDVCDITVLSGDDSLTIPMMSVGAKGIISVVSNLIPAQVKKMVDAFASGDTDKARKMHMKYYPLFRDMFVEANPIPIKTAMAIKGLIKEEFRLPMCPISDKNREIVIAAMKKSGVL